jgi:hypothetical protein
MTESPKHLDVREAVELGLDGCDIPHGIPIYRSTPWGTGLLGTNIGTLALYSL